MLTLMWNVSAALRGYLRFYMPTSIAIDMLRRPPGLKWAIPVALVATTAYLYALSLCATIIERGGPGYLNVLVIVFFWNAVKFAWTAFLTPAWMINGAVHAWRRRSPRRRRADQKDEETAARLDEGRPHGESSSYGDDRDARRAIRMGRG